MAQVAVTGLGRWLILALAVMIGSTIMPRAGAAQVTAFKQAVAEAAAKDRDIAAF